MLYRDLLSVRHEEQLLHWWAAKDLLKTLLLVTQGFIVPIVQFLHGKCSYLTLCRSGVGAHMSVFKEDTGMIARQMASAIYFIGCCEVSVLLRAIFLEFEVQARKPV